MFTPKKHWVLDRFEGECAVLMADDGERADVPGLEGREGDVFIRTEQGWLPLLGERERREARIQGKMDRLFKKPGQGPEK